MKLFEIANTGTKIVNGVEFHYFTNSSDLFYRYNKQQEEMFFTNCFEYINKMNLNVKYEVLYIQYKDKLFFYILHKNKQELIAYNYESYLYYFERYDIQLPIKFMAQYEIDNCGKDISVGTYVIDAIYDTKRISDLAGKEHAKLRQRRNNFINKVGQCDIVEYTNKYKNAVLEMYDNWKHDMKQNDKMIVDAKIFKAGLDENYLNKLVFVNDKFVFGFMAYYVVDDTIYLYSMKTHRLSNEFRNANVYMLVEFCRMMNKEYPTCLINIGAIDDTENPDDFKMQFKPDYYIENWINCKVKKRQKGCK